MLNPNLVSDSTSVSGLDTTLPISALVPVRDGGLTVASCPGVFSSGIQPRRFLWLWSPLRESNQTSSSRRFCFTVWGGVLVISLGERSAARRPLVRWCDVPEEFMWADQRRPSGGDALDEFLTVSIQRSRAITSLKTYRPLPRSSVGRCSGLGSSSSDMEQGAPCWCRICMHWRSWVFHTLVLKGAGTGRRTYFLPQARASSRRGYDPDGSSGGPLTGGP
ncbi:hypothetical protein EVAR_13445_1 [Eumeta japonica]|uniref:Uncharacterized protein n=1 Tax=Eumeta variegata TaxID=151549 RepID=A0A4C1V783_EUMVA|nr:hypothetical protein EVAR_13445_1 [Eumeta japonica]